MGCFRIVTEKDVQQLRQAKRIVHDSGWKPVPSDRRYEEKIVKYRSGWTTRMARLEKQATNYPHTTSFYNPDGKKEHFNDNPMWDSHHSSSKNSTRYGTHKTAQSILDDLDEAIKSYR